MLKKLDNEMKTLIIGFTLTAALFALIGWSKHADDMKKQQTPPVP